MALLGRFGILTKILSIVALIGIMVLGGIWYATGPMNQIDSNYSRFLERDAKSWITAARLNRNIFEIRYLEYKLIAEPDVQVMQKVESSITKAFDENVAMTTLIKQITPAYGSQADVIAGEISKLRVAMQPMIKAALASQNDKALELADKQVRPIADSAVEASRKLRDLLDAGIQKGSADLTDETIGTIRLTWIVMAAILAIGCIFGFAIAQFGIGAPLTLLVGLLQRMAKGETVELFGTDRKDEVGATARAVEEIKLMLAHKAREEAEAKVSSWLRSANPTWSSSPTLLNPRSVKSSKPCRRLRRNSKHRLAR